MTTKRATIGLALLGLLLTFAAGCAQRPGKVQLSATEFDFGTIRNDRSVSQVFEVRNVGRGTLEIAGVSTSCGCTSAAVSERRLEPGEEAELKVVYDPLAHHGATGSFMRVVYVRTNDPEVPEATLTIKVTVTGS